MLSQPSEEARRIVSDIFNKRLSCCGKVASRTVVDREGRPNRGHVAHCNLLFRPQAWRGSLGCTTSYCNTVTERPITSSSGPTVSLFGV